MCGLASSKELVNSVEILVIFFKVDVEDGQAVGETR